MHPPVSSKDSPDATLVEKQQTLVENGLPLETKRNLIKKETSWEDQVVGKLKKNTVQLLTNNPSKFAENMSWIQVVKKGK